MCGRVILFGSGRTKEGFELDCFWGLLALFGHLCLTSTAKKSVSVRCSVGVAACKHVWLGDKM